MITLELDMIPDWSVEHYGDSSYVLGLFIDFSMGLPNTGPHVLGRSLTGSPNDIIDASSQVVMAHGKPDLSVLQAHYEGTKKNMDHWPITHLHVLYRWWSTSVYKPGWVPEWTPALEQWYDKCQAWVEEVYEKNNGFPLKSPYLPADEVSIVNLNAYGGR